MEEQYERTGSQLQVTPLHLGLDDNGDIPPNNSRLLEFGFGNDIQKGKEGTWV